MISAYIGIDPGSSSGCITCIMEYNGNIQLKHCEMSKSTERDMYLFLQDCKNKSHRIIASYEKVHAMPGQGVTSVFTFGQNYGYTRGVLVALEIPYVDVTPQAWMKFYSMKREKEESKSDWKKRLKQMAEQLFPGYRFTADTADSTLIANYTYHVRRF